MAWCGWRGTEFRVSLTFSLFFFGRNSLEAAYSGLDGQARLRIRSGTWRILFAVPFLCLFEFLRLFGGLIRKFWMFESMSNWTPA
ncbi:hypothetical protein DL98DRAFT_28522 [Cadophora sp. DSE1049]|nr:hypothetical protein DL98DRAFT_28522 [Cadophora sp. DSE1049]